MISFIRSDLLREKSCTLLGGGMVGPQNRLGCCGEQKNTANVGNRTSVVVPVV